MSQNVNLDELFGNAEDEGNLSPEAALAINNANIGAQIQQGLGITVDDVQASEVTLVTLMPDDSGSIRFVSGNTEAVRTGHNSVLDALGDTKQVDSILVHTRYLNGYVLYPYTTLDKATRMDTHNYDPQLGTPLYDQTLVVLATVAAKAQEFEDNGVVARTVTCIITDGSDQHSVNQARALRDVEAMARSMLQTENHIIIGMGIEDDFGTDFNEVFRNMGIPDQFILTPGKTPSEIRKAFAVVSQSAARASQGGGSFSQVALGGFNTP